MDALLQAPEFPTLNHIDLTRQTYTFLRDQILTRQIKPGEKISIEALAAGLGVSRTPVVNALKLLEGDGLVEIFPRRGTFVTEFTQRDVNELFEIRLIVELHAVEEIFRLGLLDELETGFENYMDRMNKETMDDEYIHYEAFISFDRDLHTLLIDLLENRRLSRIYQDLNIHMRVARAHYLNTVQNARQVQQEHNEMLGAIRARDLTQLKETLTSHIITVRDRIIEMLEERGGKL